MGILIKGKFVISDDFKNAIKNCLKNDYDIEFHRMGLFPTYGYPYREVTLHCSNNDKNFTLQMIVNIGHDFEENSKRSFYIFADERHLRCSQKLSEKINSDVIKSSIYDARIQLCAFNLDFMFIFGHSKVILVSGLYKTIDEYFEIRKIESKIETTSFLKFSSAAIWESVFCHVCIMNNEITIRPEHGYAMSPVFKVASVIEDGGMDVFKANLIKSFLFYIKSLYGNHTPEYNFDEDSCLNLTYQEIKDNLLVIQMNNI